MPTFDDVVLRATFDGANGATTATDFSNSPKTLTFVGPAQISTAQSRWGGASLQLNGSTAYVTAPDSNAWNLGSADFTIECWVRPAAVTAATAFGIVCQRRTSSFQNAWSLLHLGNSVEFRYSTTGTTTSGTVVGGAAVAVGVWSHIAVVRAGTTITVYVDGIGGTPNTIGTGTIFNSTSVLAIGATNSESPFFTGNGHLDDLRITNPGAWYIANFTPPAGPLATGPEVVARVAAPGVLRAPSLRGAGQTVQARLQIPGLLSNAAFSAFHNFSGMVQGVSSRYYGVIFGPFGVLRVPISSWQATARDTGSSYLQCVVPACGPYLDEINAALAFSVVREAVIPGGGTVSYTMGTAQMSAPTVSTGPRSQSATLSGYTPALSLPASDTLTLPLPKVRAVFSRPGGLMVRSGIDWLLRPGMQAAFDGQSFPVSYINYFVNANDQFMDVGERVAEIA